MKQEDLHCPLLTCLSKVTLRLAFGENGGHYECEKGHNFDLEFFIKQPEQEA